MEGKEKRPVIRLQHIRKRYRLGQYNADTFQEEFKLWIDRVRNGEREAGKNRSGKEKKSFYALDDVDLTVYEGERLGIIGKNGAGKSTLLKLMCRITAPTSGKIQLWGRVASMLELGTGFQWDMTGRENIYLNAAIHGMSRTDIEKKIEDIIDFSELREFIDTPIKHYSSGMFVKLGFAVAAFLDCEIMIMDEVLAVGDLQFQQKCLKKMRDVSLDEGRTILYVSHNMKTIQRLCSRCIVMEKGKIIFDGDTQEAVRIYTKMNEIQSGKMIYDKGSRPFDENLRSEIRLNFDSLVCAEGEPVFHAGMTAVFRLECTALTALKRVGFRFELWAEDGTKVGTMLSKTFADLDPGKNSVIICMDPVHLAYGDYRADLVAYLFDDEGNEDILDGVYPGVIFTVTTPIDRDNYLDWHHNYWGNVRLHDLIVRKEENRE